MLFQASVQSMTKLLPALGNYINIKYMYMTIMKKKKQFSYNQPFFFFFKREINNFFFLQIIFFKYFNFILILKYR